MFCPACLTHQQCSKVIRINTSGRLENPKWLWRLSCLLSSCKPSYHNSKFLQTGAVPLSTFYFHPEASTQPTWYLMYQPQSFIPQFWDTIRQETHLLQGIPQDFNKRQFPWSPSVTWMPNKLLYWRSQNDAANQLWASYLGSKQICCIYSSSSAQPCQVPLKLARISLQQKPHVSRHRRFPRNTQRLGWDATESTALGDVPA